MTFAAKGPPLVEGGPLEKLSSLGGVDGSESAPKTAPAQENLLREALKALAAEEICADTLENIQRAIIAAGWRATAALLTHAAGCIDCGDYLNGELNRQRAREQFLQANDAFRTFQEARGAEATSRFAAEAFS